MRQDSGSSQAQRKNQAAVSRLVLAFVGTQYGWLWCYSAFSSMGMAVRMLTAVGPVHTLIERKYFMDELAETVLVRCLLNGVVG